MKDNMNKDWRPDDWFNRHTPKVLEAGFMRQGMMALANAYEDGASQMLVARDKWWRGLLQEVNEANDLKDLQERFAHLLRYTADLEVKQ